MKINPLSKFFLKAAGLFVAWQLLYGLWIKPDQRLDNWLSYGVGKGAAVLMQLFGQEAACNKLANGSIMFYWNNQQAVFIGNACNGMEVMALFLGFILLISGSWKKKAWFLPLGMGIIFISNSIRVALLGVNYLSSPDTFDFNHKYTYLIAVYSIVFLLWMWWVEHFSGLRRKTIVE